MKGAASDLSGHIKAALRTDQVYTPGPCQSAAMKRPTRTPVPYKACGGPLTSSLISETLNPMKPTTLGTMWADLLTSEIAAKSAQHHVTTRAKIYLEAGMPLDQVLDALKISRATWYRRAADHDEWRAANAAAGQRATPADS